MPCACWSSWVACALIVRSGPVTLVPRFRSMAASLFSCASSCAISCSCCETCLIAWAMATGSMTVTCAVAGCGTVAVIPTARAATMAVVAKSLRMAGILSTRDGGVGAGPQVRGVRLFKKRFCPQAKGDRRAEQEEARKRDEEIAVKGRGEDGEEPGSSEHKEQEPAPTSGGDPPRRKSPGQPREKRELRRTEGRGVARRIPGRESLTCVIRGWLVHQATLALARAALWAR